MSRELELLKVVKQYRKKFNKQKKGQKVPKNTCPLIDDVLSVFEPDAFEADRLEQIREANSNLRQLGIDWYELCRDLLDDLELTLKLQEKLSRDSS